MKPDFSVWIRVCPATPRKIVIMEKINNRIERTGIGKKRDEPERKNVSLDNSKYKTARGTVVVVEYEGGTTFILNYNSFAIKVEYEGTKYEIEAMGFAKIG